MLRVTEVTESDACIIWTHYLTKKLNSLIVRRGWIHLIQFLLANLAPFQLKYKLNMMYLSNPFDSFCLLSFMKSNTGINIFTIIEFTLSQTSERTVLHTSQTPTISSKECVNHISNELICCFWRLDSLSWCINPLCELVVVHRMYFITDQVQLDLINKCVSDEC
jgi:hypothetical protein